MNDPSSSTGAMSPWVEALVQSLREARAEHLQPGSRDPIHLLGEIQGLGKSWTVGLAYEKRRIPWKGDLVFVTGIVAPWKQHPTGWMAMNWTRTLGTWSPGHTAAVASHQVAGLWLTPGWVTAPDAMRMRLTLNDGRVAEVALRNGGFLSLADEHPYPMQVSILGAEGQQLEAFRFPRYPFLPWLPWARRSGRR